jgi:hypothetical protein
MLLMCVGVQSTARSLAGILEYDLSQIVRYEKGGWGRKLINSSRLEPPIISIAALLLLKAFLPFNMPYLIMCTSSMVPSLMTSRSLSRNMAPT